jgi:hypothetical protein
MIRRILHSLWTLCFARLDAFERLAPTRPARSHA